MKNKIKKFLVSFTCVLLAFVMSFTTACSCSPNNASNNPPSNSESSISGGGCNNEDNGSNNGDINTPVAPSTPDDKVFEDYELNEAENFVYSLIYSDLTKQYGTFTGYVTLQSNVRSAESVEVYGISYVDYEEGYIDESGKTYFSAGFISFPGEPVINQANIDAGLEIVSLEEEYDELFSYVYTYTTEDVHMHCVIDNKYVKYDVVDGMIQYEEEPYVEGMDVDYTRGNIYSYDIEDYVYIVEEQDYVPVSGVSLLGEADYQDIMDEVNRILQTQEANLTYAEIESYVSQSQDALYSYLLGLQEETFMGIPTAELVDIVRDLDPMQHLQIGVDANGTTTIEIIEVTKLPSLWEKIATSLVCAFGIVGGFVCSAVGCPVIGGALIGASMEAFSQVVINNTPVSDIQWAQVAVAAVSGAIAGGVSGAINGIATKGVGQLIMKEVADTLCDSVIGGGEFFVNSLIAGCSFEEACKYFGYGVIAGAVISGGIKIGSAAIKGSAKLIKKLTTSTVTDLSGKQLTKLSSEVVGEGFSELQEKTMQKTAREGAESFSDSIRRSSNTSSFSKHSNDVLVNMSDKLPNGEKMLYGKVKGSNLKGAHSPTVTKSVDFGYGTKQLNVDGTITYTDVTYKLNGKIGTKKYHTVFPETWSDEKIAKAIKYVGENCPVGSIDKNGCRLFCAYIDDVQIVVIRDSLGNYTAGYPSGGMLQDSLLRQFSIEK